MPKQKSTLWDDISPPAARRLLLAALESFAERGYHLTTTRDIATRAGLSPAAVYVHYASKDQILQTISRVGHEDCLHAFDAGLAEGADPVTRVRHGVFAFARWHAENHELARVIQYELNSVPTEARKPIRRLRRSFEERLRSEIKDGIDAGVFSAADIPGAALAILSLCIDIARWYRRSQRRTPEDVASLYAELSLRMLNARCNGSLADVLIEKGR